MARDVRKIARNCFPDLDPESYEQDQMDVGHAIELVVEKWSKVHRRGGIKVAVTLAGTSPSHASSFCVGQSALQSDEQCHSGFIPQCGSGFSQNFHQPKRRPDRRGTLLDFKSNQRGTVLKVERRFR